MSGTAVQINNAASGTVYITDDAAVDASMLDWLHRQEDATANTIPEHYAPMSSAQPKGANKGTSKGKDEMVSGSPIDGQNHAVDADGASDRARSKSRSPLRARAITRTPTSSKAATAAPTATLPVDLYGIAPQTPPRTLPVAEGRRPLPTPLAIMDDDPNDNKWHSSGVIQ